MRVPRIVGHQSYGICICANAPLPRYFVNFTRKALMGNGK